MIILGINGGLLQDGGVESAVGAHDSSACLLKDGELIAAVEQERLDRIKKSHLFPTDAIRACLRSSGTSIDDIDYVAVSWPEKSRDLAMSDLYFHNGQRGPSSSRAMIQGHLAEVFNWRVSSDRIRYYQHHLAHALSTFVRSGFAEALTVVLDGAGETDSGTIYHAKGSDLTKLRTHPIEDSLGFFYWGGTKFLGYDWGDEYKIMGLAPYGDPSRYRDMLGTLYELHPLGQYKLFDNAPYNQSGMRSLDRLPHTIVSRTCYASGLSPRLPGEDFLQEHMDFAAALQDTVERIALHVLSFWREETGLSRLCLTGGVAHNSSLNGRILQQQMFDEVFVHPASHDAGAAEGATFAAQNELDKDNQPRKRMHSASLGPRLGDSSEIAIKLDDWSLLIGHTRLQDVADKSAELLASGAVLGWAQGRSEFGPRALGNRSILADPRPVENRDRINFMVKKREGYRPFAPVVTKEAAGDYFEISKTVANHDFMSFVVPVLPTRRNELGAVTHVDGTARVQIIDPRTNRTFHDLVVKFGERTGTPVLLNTSFNNNVEPIIQTVEDALTCFLTTDLSYLVIEDHLVWRRFSGQMPLEDMIIRFKPGVRAVRTETVGSVPMFTTQELVLKIAGLSPKSVRISLEMFRILSQIDGSRTLRDIADHERLPKQQLQSELLQLWSKRLVDLAPRTSNKL
jgi:decarbamoylnovobiocin carbamoyltransferase/7-O-carbamoyltransferase